MSSNTEAAPSSREERNPFAINNRILSKSVVEAEGVGIRAALRIPITVLVLIAYLIFARISFTNITASELEKANDSVRSEVNYLCLQLESLEQRSEAFGRIVDISGSTPEQLAAADQSDYSLLSDPVGNVLSGYTLAETGTVALVADGVVVASDERGCLSAAASANRWVTLLSRPSTRASTATSFSKFPMPACPPLRAQVAGTAICSLGSKAITPL